MPPALLLALELGAGLLDDRFGTAAHLGFVGLLAALVALQAIRRVDAAAWLVLGLSALVGAAGAAAYAAFAPVRTFASVLAAAPVLFLGSFLLDSPTAKLVREGDKPVEVARIGPATTPVLLLVFDELPLNSLLDERGQIDAARFPHFAELAQGSDWFPNATTVHDGTVGAVPALLTGRLPRPGELPRFDDHPRNLFTLLAGRYRVEAFDRSTSLCPPRVCREADRSFGGELWDLAEDAGIVYAHLLLPPGLAKRLPSVTERWAGFVGESSDEPAQFERFLTRLTPSRLPALHYGHVLLPHSPWQYLPSGERYDLRPPGFLWGPDEVWTMDEGLVVQSLQRHLLQTAYVDALLGRLVARLRSTGLYDRSLLVVVADHGISFRPGGKRRPVSPANIEDIAFVPLLVKRPGQHRGRVLERHVRTVDVVPTIVDVIGIRSPWPFDGHSAYGPSSEPDRVVVRKDRGEEVALPVREAVSRRRAALAGRVALLGAGTPPSSLFGIGRYRSLVGRRVPPGTASTGDVELDFVQRPGADVLALGGRVPTGVDNVAVVVSGRVAAVAPVFGGRFWALATGAGGEFRLVAVDGLPRAPRVKQLTFRVAR